MSFGKDIMYKLVRYDTELVLNEVTYEKKREKKLESVIN